MTRCSPVHIGEDEDGRHICRETHRRGKASVLMAPQRFELHSKNLVGVFEDE